MTLRRRAINTVSDLVPLRIKQQLMPRVLLPGLGATADLGSALNYWRLAVAHRQSASVGPPMSVRMKALGGREVLMRPGTTDILVAHLTFVSAFHLPPPELPPDSITSIMDLGANIGLTAAHMAVLYPRSTVVAVELDAGNAQLAMKNTEIWRNRCIVVPGAAWIEDGRVQYRLVAGHEYELSVETCIGSQSDLVSAPAYSLTSLADRLEGSGGTIDYIKMDIEGAEARVLRENTDWARRTRAIKVEVHRPYTAEECASDLTALGFATRPSGGNVEAVTGIRRG